jgi:hypothetical protein
MMSAAGTTNARMIATRNGRNAAKKKKKAALVMVMSLAGTCGA